MLGMQSLPAMLTRDAISQRGFSDWLAQRVDGCEEFLAKPSSRADGIRDGHAGHLVPLGSSGARYLDRKSSRRVGQRKLRTSRTGLMRIREPSPDAHRQGRRVPLPLSPQRRAALQRAVEGLRLNAPEDTHAPQFRPVEVCFALMPRHAAARRTNATHPASCSCWRVSIPPVPSGSS